MGAYVLAGSALVSAAFCGAFFIAICREDSRKPLGIFVKLSVIRRERTAKTLVGAEATSKASNNIVSFPRNTRASAEASRSIEAIRQASGLNAEAK